MSEETANDNNAGNENDFQFDFETRKDWTRLPHAEFRSSTETLSNGYNSTNKTTKTKAENSKATQNQANENENTTADTTPITIDTNNSTPTNNGTDTQNRRFEALIAERYDNGLFCRKSDTKTGNHVDTQTSRIKTKNESPNKTKEGTSNAPADCREIIPAPSSGNNCNNNCAVASIKKPYKTATNNFGTNSLG